MGNAEYCFSEKFTFFLKCSSSERADDVQKNMLWKSSPFADICILNNSFAKKVALPKSYYPKELLSILKWWLLGRNFAQKKSHSEKITAAKNWLLWKRSSSKKSDALSKQLLRKSNCCVVVTDLKKCEESNFSESKAVLKKSTYARREIAIWKEISN